MPRSNAGLEYIMKLGYTLVIVTVMIMIWASLSGAREIDVSQHPPCAFNALCTCSKSSPDLGVVECRQVHFPAIPKVINSSKLFMLRMDDTGLREVEPYFFQATGLYKLDISNNPVTEIPDEAFYGLERSLWELVLENNQLIEIPTRAIQNLKKLRMLDLRGNDITRIEVGAFRGLDKSLQSLILADNSITQLLPGSVTGLPNLDSIDLSGNNLVEVDSSAFKDGLGKLSKVFLANNLLKNIPYSALQPLRLLRVLDLSHNLIRNFTPDDDDNGKVSYKLTLDVLQLQYNSIETIPSVSFGYFDTINSTFLDGNPINHIEDNAFRQAKIRELYIRHCGLDFISPEAFAGLESSLQILDLSGNNLTHLADNLFKGFDYLRFLNLKDNVIKQLDQRQASPFAGLNLFKLDTTGHQNQPFTLRELSTMKNLRSLTTSHLPSLALGPEDFAGFSPELEELKMTRAGLKSLKNRAFTNIRGLKRLDMSENRIDSIEANAFAEIGHSLVSLRMSHGLGAQILSIPHEAFRHLTALEALDLSNNKLKTLTDSSFHFMKNLVSVELHDNQIDSLAKGTFQSDIHTNLAVISLRYNALKLVQSHTFVDLEELNAIYLDDNRLESIEKRSFMNLDNLKMLNLRGNRLGRIAVEAFQNLPELEKLDLAYNQLPTFDFDYFDQVGSLTSLEVDVSHNQIKSLGEPPVRPDTNESSPMSLHANGNSRDHVISHTNIKSLDLSANNITKIVGGYFKPAELSLMKLSLAGNRLTNISREVFGNMPHLQWLDLENNAISEVDFDSFKFTRKLQVLKLSNNVISDIPTELFRNVKGLRVLEMAYNNLKYLPDSLIVEEGLERLDLSHNQFTKIPVTSLSNLAALALCELDLSHNHIGAIHSIDLSNKFRSLSVLDLSHNRLVRLEDAAFATLPRLSLLDLSHNDELEVMGKAFIGLENSLIELRLANVSLSAVPELSNPSLRVLKISHNDLPSIPPELAANMSSLRELDLSENDLTHVPLITHSLPNLKSLSLSGNPISTMTNTSLLGAADTLEHLDIANINLNGIENGILNKLHFLRTLRISSYPNVQHFNIPRILENADNLRELWIEAPKPPSQEKSDNGSKTPKPVSVPSSDLRKEMEGMLPRKLKSLTFGGAGFNKLADNVLKGLQSTSVHVSFHNTSLTSFPSNFFKNIGKNVRNISLDLEDNNQLLKSVPNPNSAHYLHLPEHVFLTDLKISGNALACDCEIGWVEFWQRKRRQYMCPAQPWIENGSINSFFKQHASVLHSHSNSEDCEDSADNLREATCSNKRDENLLDVLKRDLECGWGSAAPRLGVVPAIAFVSVFVVLLI